MPMIAIGCRWAAFQSFKLIVQLERQQRQPLG